MQQTADAWAMQQFEAARLGDIRRTRRLIRVVSTLASRAEHPNARKFPSMAEQKAFYRLIAQPDVTYEAILEPHTARTHEQCAQFPHVIMIQDSTALDFSSHEATTGLGRIGDNGGQGIMAHTTLAVGVQGWDEEVGPVSPRLLGLVDQEAWVRTHPPLKGRERRRERMDRPKESDCWARNLGRLGAAPEGTTHTYVADREADIYEVFAERLAPGMEMVIRACRPRTLIEGPARTLPEAAAAAGELGRTTLGLRARPGQAAREAVLTLRAATVRLKPSWRPDHRFQPLDLWVVQAAEENPPKGVKGLKWILLTNRPVGSLAEARRVAAIYQMRWMIEEFHKVLKTGAGIEQSQLRTGKKLMALLAILSVVAVRLLDAKLIGRSGADTPVDPGICPPEMQLILEHRFGPPKDGWTMRAFIRAVAMLGGFRGRKGDGEPGWSTIWDGWAIARQQLQGFLLARQILECG